jgi:hypothetical protein
MSYQQIASAEIAAGTISTSDLADGSITGPKLGATAINANNIVDGAITNTKLATPFTTGKSIAMSIVFGF